MTILRVASPARLSVLNSPAFRSTHGIPDAHGTCEVPAMPEAQFNAHARWTLSALTTDPKTDRMPVFVPVSPYRTELDTQSAQTILDRAVRNTHAIIGRDRAAKGLPPVARAPGTQP
jgi:hypothetical protein